MKRLVQFLCPPSPCHPYHFRTEITEMPLLIIHRMIRSTGILMGYHNLYVSKLYSTYVSTRTYPYNTYVLVHTHLENIIKKKKNLIYK